MLSFLIGDAVCAFGGPVEDCGKICTMGFEEGYCGGGLIILLAVGFFVWAFMHMSNESAAQREEEFWHRQYEREKAHKEYIEEKFNLHGISSIKAKAEAGDPDAQFQLGVAYMCGVNVTLDEAEGMYWLKQAAAQGHKEADKAIYNLQQAKAKAQREQLAFEQWFRDEEFLRRLRDGY